MTLPTFIMEAALDLLPDEYHGHKLHDLDDDAGIYYRSQGIKCALRNSFCIASIRVYNSNGVNLFYVDENYSDYIDVMRLLTRSQTTEINNDKKYFDGCELEWDNTFT